MKLVAYRRDGSEHLGFVDGEYVVDPRLALPQSDGSALQMFGSAAAFIAAGMAGRRAAERLVAAAPAAARVAMSDIELAPPIRPSTLLCSGSNYRDHNAEKAGSPNSGKEPEFFVKTADCVVGPGGPIVYDPVLSQKIDCETELAVVIGKAGRHIPTVSALDHVFGYTIVNDVTARDRQVRRTPEGVVWYDLGRGKVFDSSAPLGPWIVTADEIPNPQSLKLTTRINGELRQSSTTANMIWTCAELIHFFSMNLTLKAGMVIITGTPAGTAWSSDAELGGKSHPTPGLTPARDYCRPGDKIECEIERIGVLSNEVRQFPTEVR